MKQRWNVPIIGGDRDKPTSDALGLLSASLWGNEVKKVLDNTLAFEGIRKIHELRKSCGVESKPMTVNVLRPPDKHGNIPISKGSMCRNCETIPCRCETYASIA